MRRSLARLLDPKSSQPVYNSGIQNGTGSDLGIVVAYSYLTDTFSLAVSTDGVSFSAPMAFLGSGATATGVNRNYFYGGGGPFATGLAVIPIDLSVFGIVAGGSIMAVRITGSPEADIIRVAGLAQAVPEPGAMLLLATGMAAAMFRRHRRNAQRG